MQYDFRKILHLERRYTGYVNLHHVKSILSINHYYLYRTLVRPHFHYQVRAHRKSDWEVLVYLQSDLLQY